jgi:formamidopyrimidine-DNA glycosylase
VPELPEVETVARQLKPLVLGRRVSCSQVLDRQKLDARGLSSVAGRTITDLFRQGKWIVIAFGADLYCAIHLRMTGRLIFSEGERAARRHLRLRLCFDDGAALLFYDVRRFGDVRLLNSLQPIAGPGIEPLSRSLSLSRLQQLLAGSMQPLKVWLMRQDKLVGIGNIYAAEILFAAGLSPMRRAGELTPGEARRLHQETRRILQAAIENCGTTFSDFQTARGEIGSYQRFLAVYGREGEDCPRCGEAVTKIVQQQRSTFFCGRCQR